MNEPKKEEKLKEPSDTFMRIVTNTGSGIIGCELCGRVHFAPNASFDYEEGEMEELIKKERKEPDKYCSHDIDNAISWGCIDGKQVVWGCPCNLARRWEDWIWGNRHLIMEYLTARINDRLNAATAEADQLSELGRVAGRAGLL